MLFVGIDYSITSPAICIIIPSRKIIQFYYWITIAQSKHSDTRLDPSVIIMPNETRIECIPFIKEDISSWSNDIERFTHLAEWSVNIISDAINTYDLTPKILIEGYAFGASNSSRLFQIGENGGILKYYLQTHKYAWDVVPPTQIKKYATGKGNANKEMMEIAFVDKFTFSPRNWVHQTTKQLSPSSDIIDSFYIADFCRNQFDQKSG